MVMLTMSVEDVDDDVDDDGELKNVSKFFS